LLGTTNAQAFHEGQMELSWVTIRGGILQKRRGSEKNENAGQRGRGGLKNFFLKNQRPVRIFNKVPDVDTVGGIAGIGFLKG